MAWSNVNWQLDNLAGPFTRGNAAVSGVCVCIYIIIYIYTHIGTDPHCLQKMVQAGPVPPWPLSVLVASSGSALLSVPALLGSL